MTPTRFEGICAAAVLLLVSSGGVRAADKPSSQRALTPDDYYLTQSLADPQVAPDGSWVAYLVTANDREADEPRSAVWMVRWDGAERVRLTTPANTVSMPRWSRDGRFLSFLAAPAGSETRQVMILDRRGGEARAATNVSGEIADYSWAPDGRRLLLVVSDTATGAPGTAKQPEPESKAPKPIVIDAMHFKQDEDGYAVAGVGQHLFLFDLKTQRLDALAANAGTNDSLPVWSPDGSRIAFIRTRERGADQDGMSDLEVVDASAGAAARWVIRLYSPNSQHLAFSPDGSLIAYLDGLEPKYNAYIQDRLVVVPAAGGAPRPLTGALDRAVSSPEFSADGKSLVVVLEDRDTQVPVSVAVDSGAVTRLYSGGSVITGLALASGHLAVLASTDAAPFEVHALEDGKLRPLTAHNEAFVRDVRLGTVEDVHFKSRDGTEVHGFVVKPAGFVAGRKYPTILWIHGGPNEQDEHGLSVANYSPPFERQMLAAQGYVVLAVNYRGSSGRGSKFARAIFADWGHKEVEDLLAGIDYLVAIGITDPQRLGIGGWSYGGLLTDYTIASDRRFAAAVSGAGSGNQLSMYGSDEYILQYNHEIGTPWQNPSLWIKVSYPFFHADRIHTPTFFLGGDKDFNVPIAGGEQMYQALRTLGVPTQLVVYPGQYHIFTRPSFLVDRFTRVTAWFNRYLGVAP